MTAWVAAEASSGSSGSKADMMLLFSAIQSAVKRIASLVRQSGIAHLSMPATTAERVSDQRDAPKPLDLVAVRLCWELFVTLMSDVITDLVITATNNYGA